MKLYKEYPNGERTEIIPYSYINEEEYYNIVGYENGTKKWEIGSFDVSKIKEAFGFNLINGDFYLINNFGVVLYVIGKFWSFEHAVSFIDACENDDFFVARHVSKSVEKEEPEYDVKVVVTVYKTYKNSTETNLLMLTDTWGKAMEYLDKAPSGGYMVLEETYIDGDRVGLLHQTFDF